MRFALLAALLAAPAFAQSSALVVACNDCTIFQGIQVILDGDLNTHQGAPQSVRLEQIAPGRHDIKVLKWVSPFSTETLVTTEVDFPVNVELRARVTKGKLDIFGRGPYSPPAPEPQGPSQDQLDAAQSDLTDAKEALEDVQQRVEDSSDECVTKLSGRLGALEDAIKESQAQLTRAWLDASVSKAVDAQKLLAQKCSRKNVAKWGRSLDKVVARLQRASRNL